MDTHTLIHACTFILTHTHTHTLQKGPPPIFDMIHSKPVKRKAGTSPVPHPEQGGEETSAKRHKPLPSLLQKLIHGESTKDVPCEELSVDLERISERGSVK